MDKIQFGSVPHEIDELAHKVLAGEKVATSSLLDYYLIGKKRRSKVGDVFSILNSINEEVAKVRIEKIEIKKIGDITEEFAIEEGDESLENWQAIHLSYYSGLLSSIGKGLNNNTLLVCEWFKVIGKYNILEMNNDYKVGDLIYDGAIYDGMNIHTDDLEFYKRWLPKNKNARILELCCGTGRLTIPIAHEGYDITGVDFTRSMLDQAKVKACEAGLEIEFIEADIRCLDLQKRYDLIFIPFNSIHHLYRNEDLFQVFRVVQNHLKKGGIFLLDCFNPNIQLIVEGEKEQQEIAAYATNDGRKVMIKQTMHYESDSQINRIKWHFFINGEFDSIQDVAMRMFFPQELDSYLKWNGFNLIHKFGGFEEESFNDKSEKQIFVCNVGLHTSDQKTI